MTTLTMQMHDTELTSWDNKFLNLLEQYYYMKGKLPSVEYLVEQGISPKRWHKCMANRQFREQLAARAIAVEDPDDPKLVAWALTDKQLVAANLCLDLLDTRSRRRKLQDLEIETAQWDAWMQDPYFQNYLRTRSENALKQNLHEAHMALVDKVRQGDVNAIKFYYELTGRYIPAAARAGAVDPMEVVTAVMEAVQANVTDKEQLKKVGEALVGLTAGIAVGQEIDKRTDLLHELEAAGARDA